MLHADFPRRGKCSLKRPAGSTPLGILILKFKRDKEERITMLQEQVTFVEFSAG